MASKLDHLAWLGVDAIWSSPTFPSPNVDWGYDVSDYRDVHPELGTIDDLDTLIAEARSAASTIWLDLVPNHTSDKHDGSATGPSTTSGRTRSRTTGSRSSPATARGSTTRGASVLPPPVRAAAARPRLVERRRARRVRSDPPLLVRPRRHRLPHRRRARARQGPRAARRRRATCASGPRCTTSSARGRRSRAEYDPKPTLMGETSSSSSKHVRVLPAPRPRAELRLLRRRVQLDELRPIVEKTIASLPAGATPSGSARTTTTRGSRRAGATATRRKARAALFLLLTLPGDAILYQGDEIALEDGKVPDDRILDLAEPPRDPERTPLPWTRSGEEWQRAVAAARQHESQRRGPASRPEQHAALRPRPDRAAQGVRRRQLRDAAERQRRVGLPPRRQDLRPQHDREAPRRTKGTKLDCLWRARS